MLLSSSGPRALCRQPTTAAAGSRRALCVAAPHPHRHRRAATGLSVVRAQPEQQDGSQSTQTTQQPPGEEVPVWVRRERERELQAAGKKGLPWPLYLVMSALVAIAAVGSVFEYVGGNPVFGIIQPDSPLWAPVLGLFAITGLPTAGFLFFKGVNAANEAAEQQDRMDGYIK